MKRPSKHPELDRLLKEAVVAVGRMSTAERRAMYREQAISWVYGNLAIDNPLITREMVEKSLNSHPNLLESTMKYNLVAPPKRFDVKINVRDANYKTLLNIEGPFTLTELRAMFNTLYDRIELRSDWDKVDITITPSNDVFIAGGHYSNQDSQTDPSDDIPF